MALEDLRSEMGGTDVPIATLVVLGARTRTAEKRAQRNADDETLSALAENIRTGTHPLADPDAAAAVRRSGWARPS